MQILFNQEITQQPFMDTYYIQNRAPAFGK